MLGRNLPPFLFSDSEQVTQPLSLSLGLLYWNMLREGFVPAALGLAHGAYTVVSTL